MLFFFLVAYRLLLSHMKGLDIRLKLISIYRDVSENSDTNNFCHPTRKCCDRTFQRKSLSCYKSRETWKILSKLCHRCFRYFQQLSCRLSSLCDLIGWLCWGLTSQSTIFQSYRDGAIASWVINQYFRGVKCLAQGHNTAAVGLEPRTSRSGVRHSTTEPPRSTLCDLIKHTYLNLFSQFNVYKFMESNGFYKKKKKMMLQILHKPPKMLFVHEHLSPKQ